MWPTPLKVLMIIQIVLDVISSIILLLAVLAITALATGAPEGADLTRVFIALFLLIVVMAVSIYRLVVFIKALNSEFGAEINKKVRMTAAIIAGVSIVLNIVVGIMKG